MSLLPKPKQPLADFIKDNGLDSATGKIVTPVIVVPSVGTSFKIIAANNDQRVIVQATDEKGTPIKGKTERPYSVNALMIAKLT